MPTALLLPTALFCFGWMALGAHATPQESTESEKDITIVALYRGDVETEYLAGIADALSVHELGARVDLQPTPYGDENTAFRKLEEILQDETVDLVLGPTDSGVFLRAAQELGDPDNGKPRTVPVIAPLVTATTPFDPEATFFSTNASLQRRAHRLADTLSKYWLRSIAVLHPETQFGQRTEAAFRDAVQMLRPNSAYRSLQYESEQFNARAQVNQILRDRPEALGIFGTRNEISAICNMLVEMNTTLTPYRPILFTPVDHREPDLEDVELLITTVVSEPELNDVRALTHDNVLMILDQVQAGVPFDQQKDAFHKDLVDVLRGTRQLGESPYQTPLQFAAGRNQSPLHILRVEDGEIQPVTPPGFFGRMALKVTLLWRTVGMWPIFNLFIILLIPTFFSIIDLKRWYEGRLHTLLLSSHAALFVIFNVFLVVVLYMYLAETGKIPYESTLTAIIIAMAPTTLVRSTFFNTPAGKAVGLKNLYEKFLRWLNGRLMLKKYQRRQKFVNIVAYYNTLESMRQELYQMYDNAREPGTRTELRAKLDQDLADVETNLEKRVVCARRLLTRLNWKLLESMGYVPADASLQGRDPADPDLIVKIATRYIRDRKERREVLRQHVAQVLAERPEATLPESKSGGKTYPEVRLLVQYGFFTPKRLIAAGLLPKDWHSFLAGATDASEELELDAGMSASAKPAESSTGLTGESTDSSESSPASSPAS